MKIKEAKQIISNILEWQFILMGVKERNAYKDNVDLSKYSLQDLLDANKKVQQSNNKARIMHESWKQRGAKTKGVTINMMCADRLIAAVYTALNFEPNGEGIVLINDRLVGVVKAKY